MEITAQELRLGNLVEHNGVICKVYCINSPQPIEDKRFSDKYIVTLWNNGLFDVTIDDIKPIPLTDRVIKFGFEEQFKNREGSFFCLYISADYYFTYSKPTGLSLHKKYIGIIKNYVYIKYAHQFQNLFLLETNTELPC